MRISLNVADLGSLKLDSVVKNVFGPEIEKIFSEISHDFANKTDRLETEINKNLEHTDFHLKNLEEQIENQIRAASQKKESSPEKHEDIEEEKNVQISE